MLMRPRKCWGVLVLVLAAGCGARPSGGIVDNGHHPQIPDEPDDHKDRSDPVPEPSVRSRPQLAILGDFVVTVPSLAWEVASYVDRTVVSDGDEKITFAYVDAPCAVPPERIPAGFDMYWCESNRTVFGVGDATFVQAEHAERTNRVETILRSFRQR